jgi:hypothetical protein
MRGKLAEWNGVDMREFRVFAVWLRDVFEGFSKF